MVSCCRGWPVTTAWALSCSSRSVPAIGALCVAQDLRDVRLAVWHRTPAPHPHARIVTAWEGVFYSAARSTRDPDGPISDVLLGVGARGRATLPGSVIGMKPPAFCAWVFELLGAMPGDDLDDLFPGSGIVTRAWRQWVGEPSQPPASSTLWSRAAASDASGST